MSRAELGVIAAIQAAHSLDGPYGVDASDERLAK